MDKNAYICILNTPSFKIISRLRVPLMVGCLKCNQPMHCILDILTSILLISHVNIQAANVYNHVSKYITIWFATYSKFKYFLLMLFYSLNSVFIVRNQNILMQQKKTFGMKFIEWEKWGERHFIMLSCKKKVCKKLRIDGDIFRVMLIQVNLNIWLFRYRVLIVLLSANSSMDKFSFGKG